jgi:alginate production protein
MRLGGSASFRYLGELVRPELSNLWVATAGIGIRPARDISIEVAGHAYRQDVAAPFLRGSRLREDPNGEHRDLGYGIDVVIGIERWRPVALEIVLGYFAPGPGFDERDDAFFVLIEVEWSF